MIDTLKEKSFNNYFELLGVQERFSLDLLQIEKKRKELLLTVHPDRFSNGSDLQKRLALQWTTKINEAFAVLKDPAQRAIYLCKNKGKIFDIEKSKAFSIEVLEKQMELREKLSEVVKDLTDKKFKPKSINDLEHVASTMLIASVEVMAKLFDLNFFQNDEVLKKIEVQINICLFAQKFLSECVEVRRRFV